MQWRASGSSKLTVVAPRTGEDVLDVGVAALLLAHLGDWNRSSQEETESTKLAQLLDIGA